MPRTDAHFCVQALINYLAVMALVNTTVGVEPATRADFGLASLPVPVMVVRYLDMAVSLAGSLAPVYLHRTFDVPAPLLQGPSLRFENTIYGTYANTNKLQLVSAPDTSAALPVAQTPRSQESRCDRLPFDVSALFRGQPLPACSAEDLAFWAPTTILTTASETLVSRAEIDLDDLVAPGVYARSVPASGLFPSVSDAHIGFRAPCELPPLPRIADAFIEVDSAVEFESDDDTDTPVTPAQFKWTAESGVPLMDALGISPATATVGTVHAHSEALSDINFSWNVTSGVPLMKALGFASPALNETKTGPDSVDFKWTAESGMSLMDALGVSGVKLGVVHSV